MIMGDTSLVLGIEFTSNHTKGTITIVKKKTAKSLL